MMTATSSKAVQWPEPRAGKGINIPLICALKPNTCIGDTPCKHNNVGDNTCFGKQVNFGVAACPAGTTNTAGDNLVITAGEAGTYMITVTDKRTGLEEEITENVILGAKLDPTSLAKLTRSEI